MVTQREQLLGDASERIAGKGDEYGTPEDNFAQIAASWTLYLRSKGLLPEGKSLVASDIPLLMTLLKVVRLQRDPTHRDSILDVAGYAGCLAEIVEPKARQPEGESNFPPALFVVGNRVRIIGESAYHGRCGTVTEVKTHGAYQYRVRVGDGSLNLFVPEELELVRR